MVKNNSFVLPVVCFCLKTNVKYVQAICQHQQKDLPALCLNLYIIQQLTKTKIGCLRQTTLILTPRLHSEKKIKNKKHTHKKRQQQKNKTKETKPLRRECEHRQLRLTFLPTVLSYRFCVRTATQFPSHTYRIANVTRFCTRLRAFTASLQTQSLRCAPSSPSQVPVPCSLQIKLRTCNLGFGGV